MRSISRVIVVVLLVCAVAAVLITKRRRPETEEAPETVPAQTYVAATHRDPDPATESPTGETLPRLVDLGAGKCIPCKLMAPILEGLKKEYASTFSVEFIDVWEDPEAGEKYGIRMIPTQIFYDATGKELFRHEGFFGRDEILGKWKEHGVAASMDPAE